MSRRFFSLFIALFLCAYLHAQKELITVPRLDEINDYRPIRHCYINDSIRLRFDDSIQTILSVKCNNGVILRDSTAEYFTDYFLVAKHRGPVKITAKAVTKKNDTLTVIKKLTAIKPPQLAIKIVWDSLVLKNKYEYILVNKRTNKKINKRWGEGAFVDTRVMDDKDSLITYLIGSGYTPDDSSLFVTIKNGYKIKLWPAIVDRKTLLFVPMKETVYIVGTLNNDKHSNRKKKAFY